LHAFVFIVVCRKFHEFTHTHTHTHTHTLEKVFIFVSVFVCASVPGQFDVDEFEAIITESLQAFTAKKDVGWY
jgi:hypothetical protein